MARILIVGCGCRGRALTGALIAAGHQVRGTSRHERARTAIEAAGAQLAVADPLRLTTLMRALEGVSVACWLLASAHGEVDALHGTRLEAMLDLLVDSHVRGFVYEAAGTVESRLLAGGGALVERAGRAHSMPVKVVDVAPEERGAWLSAMTDAVASTLR